MKKLVAGLSIVFLISGCSQPQQDFAKDCGVNTSEIHQKIMSENPSVNLESVTVKDASCNLEFKYAGGHQESMSNTDMTDLLLAGGAGMLAGYMMSNKSERAMYQQNYIQPRRDYRREAELQRQVEREKRKLVQERKRRIEAEKRSSTQQRPVRKSSSRSTFSTRNIRRR